MKTTDLSSLIASVPVDKSAGVVTGRSGIHYDRVPEHTCVVQHRDGPPRTIPVPAAATDLTGRRVGRLKVVGFLGRLNPKKKALWLVRCVCGIYEHRTGKAIGNPRNTDDACHTCRNQEFLKVRGSSVQSR